MDMVIPGDERPAGRLVPSCSDPAGDHDRCWHTTSSPTAQLRASGVIESGGSC